MPCDSFLSGYVGQLCSPLSNQGVILFGSPRSTGARNRRNAAPPPQRQCTPCAASTRPSRHRCPNTRQPPNKTGTPRSSACLPHNRSFLRWRGEPWGRAPGPPPPRRQNSRYEWVQRIAKDEREIAQFSLDGPPTNAVAWTSRPGSVPSVVWYRCLPASREGKREAGVDGSFLPRHTCRPSYRAHGLKENRFRGAVRV